LLLLESKHLHGILKALRFNFTFDKTKPGENCEKKFQALKQQKGAFEKPY
jgi:hypothetical protein